MMPHRSSFARGILLMALCGLLVNCHDDDDDHEGSIPSRFTHDPTQANLVTFDVATQQRVGLVVQPETTARPPLSAIVWYRGTAYIFLQETEQQFHRVPLPLPSAAANNAPRLVVQGAQILLSEEFKQGVAGEE